MLDGAADVGRGRSNRVGTGPQGLCLRLDLVGAIGNAFHRVAVQRALDAHVRIHDAP